MPFLYKLFKRFQSFIYKCKWEQKYRYYKSFSKQKFSALLSILTQKLCAWHLVGHWRDGKYKVIVGIVPIRRVDYRIFVFMQGSEIIWKGKIKNVILLFDEIIFRFNRSFISLHFSHMWFWWCSLCVVLRCLARKRVSFISSHLILNIWRVLRWVLFKNILWAPHFCKYKSRCMATLLFKYFSPSLPVGVDSSHFHPTTNLQIIVTSKFFLLRTSDTIQIIAVSVCSFSGYFE